MINNIYTDSTTMAGTTNTVYNYGCSNERSEFEHYILIKDEEDLKNQLFKILKKELINTEKSKSVKVERCLFDGKGILYKVVIGEEKPYIYTSPYITYTNTDPISVTWNSGVKRK